MNSIRRGFTLGTFKITNGFNTVALPTVTDTVVISTKIPNIIAKVLRKNNLEFSGVIGCLFHVGEMTLFNSSRRPSDVARIRGKSLFRLIVGSSIRKNLYLADVQPGNVIISLRKRVYCQNSSCPADTKKKDSSKKQKVLGTLN